MTKVTRSILLALLCGYFGSCKGEISPPSQVKHGPHDNLAAILPHDDGWKILGNTHSVAVGARPTSWMITGPDPLVRKQLPDDMYLRSAAALSDDRIAVVGEVIGSSESGPLGHHEYRGVILTLESSGLVRDQRVLGTLGVTGFSGVAAVNGQAQAVGIQGAGRLLKGWWVSGGAERDLKLDVVTGIRAEKDGVVIFGQRGATTLEPGAATIVAHVLSGEVRWTWQGPKHSVVTNLSARAGGGWIGVGQHDNKAWIFTLGADGVLMSSHQPNVPGSISSGEVVASHPTGVILVCGLQNARIAHTVWCGLASPNGLVQDLAPITSPDALGRVSGLIPSETGWWLAGTEQALPGPVEGVVWRLNMAGRLAETLRLRTAQ